MKHLAETLSGVISRSYEGNKSTLAAAAGVDRSVLSRLCSGSTSKPPTPTTLSSIVSVMSTTDRRQVLLAAARDYLPSEYQCEIFEADPASELIRNQLPPDVAAVIRYLEADALTDEDTRAHIRRIGRWIGLYGENPAAIEQPEAKGKNPFATKHAIDSKEKTKPSKTSKGGASDSRPIRKKDKLA